MDRFYGYNTCTADTTNTDTELLITHETIAEYLHSQELPTHITCIQISTCHKYILICFNDRDIRENFCEEEHFISNDIITFARRGAVVITTAQLHSTKPELMFCAGSNPACGVLEIRDGEDL